MMKSFKSIVFAALFGIGLLASCSTTEDPIELAPVISFNDKDGIEIDSDSTISGKIISDAGLERVVFTFVSKNGSTDFKTVDKFDNNKLYLFDLTFTNVPKDLTGIKVTALDKNKKTSDKTLEVKNVVLNTPLAAAVEFKLGYPANNPSKNPVSKYGVEYDSNTSAVTAKFAGGFLMLSKTDYEAITTVEQLVEKYKAGSKVTSFTVDSDAKFSEKYFISIENDIYYLIRMTGLEFKAGDNVASFTMRK